jgi:hypothetical protein
VLGHLLALHHHRNDPSGVAANRTRISYLPLNFAAPKGDTPEAAAACDLGSLVENLNPVTFPTVTTSGH